MLGDVLSEQGNKESHVKHATVLSRLMAMVLDENWLWPVRYLIDVGAVVLLVPLERGPQLVLAPRADDSCHLVTMRLPSLPDGFRELCHLHPRDVLVDALRSAAVRPHQAHQQLKEVC